MDYLGKVSSPVSDGQRRPLLHLKGGHRKQVFGHALSEWRGDTTKLSQSRAGHLTRMQPQARVEYRPLPEAPTGETSYRPGMSVALWQRWAQQCPRHKAGALWLDGRYLAS